MCCCCTCLLSSSSVHLLLAQRILDQDNISWAWHHCLWVWILTPVHSCRRDLFWCLLRHISLHYGCVTKPWLSSAVLQIYPLPSCEARNVLCGVFIFFCIVLLVPRNSSQSGTIYIPCLSRSLLRTYLVLFAFVLQLLVNHKFKVELLFDWSRLSSCLSCFPMKKFIFLYFPFFSSSLLTCHCFPVPSLPCVFNQKQWLS